VLQDPRLALVLVLLTVVVVRAGHRAATQAGSTRERVWIWATLIFLIWPLGGFHSLHA
jgi:hypothetical protein